ncbi:MAG: IS1182 family transposase [Acidimicrobiales bacterium]
MALGSSDKQRRFDDPAVLLGDRLAEGSLYRLLSDHGDQLFGDDYLSDLYLASKKGRPTVPARVLATVMLLQSFEGLSDREAIDRLGADLRWQAACGVAVAAEPFHPTVLVGARNRLRSSERPNRLLEDTVALAKEAGVVKSKIRVLDSTALYDAVATQDTVTQLRSAIRKVLCVVDAELAERIRSVLTRDDDYDTVGKPPCDWDDPAAREALVDALVKDAVATLEVIDGAGLGPLAKGAADLLALVAGQDVAEGDDGVFRIVRGVAKDRVISSVDTEARHGHKSAHRRFDGYKTHIAADPESEIITEAVATPANAHDHDAVDELVAEVLADPDDTDTKPMVVGDAAYGDGATRAKLRAAGVEVMAKLAPVRNTTGGFSKDRFSIDTEAGTVTCPAGQTVAITASRSGGGKASFGALCSACPLRSSCTSARRGRSITIHPHEDELALARNGQRDPGWLERYRATRPMVERKIAHFTRRPWGGRKARCRGLARVTTDVKARAGVLNLARLAALGLTWSEMGWTVA